MQQLALITGTTHGIGRVTAMELARAGHHVVMLCRNATLAAQLTQEIGTGCPGARADFLQCDLADLANVHSTALAVRNQFGAPSLLILNAGVATTSRKRTPTGMDLNFAVNHLGHFLLVELLRDNMTAGGRIITVASLAHTYGKLDLDAVANPAERIGALPSYARSKLANMLHSLALARRLEGTTIRANCLHPGIVATNLLPRWVQWLQQVVRGQMLDARRGAYTTLQLALAPEHAQSHGLYFDENAQPTLPSMRARDVALQEALWQRSLQWAAPWLAKADTP